MPRQTTTIRPQRGPQEDFLASPADIAIYGGAAGGGKSWALLLEPLRHVQNPNFGAVIFRRTMPQITAEGGLWDESAKLYASFAKPVTTPYPVWTFPSGAAVSFRHLEHDKTVYDWQGSQIALIGFDELTHFSEAQFWYMLSRNRSLCGARPYVRATCNPDPDSFVARLIDWWIDQDTGYAIPERSGKIRYFVRVNDELHFADDAAELRKRFPAAGEPKSLTFVAASIEDNKILMKADPGYLANLNAMPTVERERLKKGNWKIRDERTVIFKPSWWRYWPDDKKFPKFEHVFAVWDTAYTAADMRLGGQHAQDVKKIAYSACLTLGIWLDEKDCDDQNKQGRHKLFLIGAWWGRVDWDDLLNRVQRVSQSKLHRPSDAHLIEAAASGKDLIATLRRNPKNRVIGVKPTPGDGKIDAKVLRAHLASPYLKRGFLYAPNRQWAKDTIAWLAGFPGGDPPSADLADCLSMGITHLSDGWWIHHEDDDLPEIAGLMPRVDDDDDDEVPTHRRVALYG